MFAKKKKPAPQRMASPVRKVAVKVEPDIRKWLLIFASTLLLGASIAAGYLWYQTVPVAPVEKEQLMPIRLVEIQGQLQQVSQQEILSVLKTQSMNQATDDDSINFLTTDLLSLEQSLETIPWVYRVQVRRIWPDKLVIEVEEQQAVAIWNKDQLVNRFGKLFKPEQMPELDLPVLAGVDEDLSMMLETFTELQKQFESAELQLHDLYLDKRRAWQLKLSNGIELNVGRKDLMGRVNRFINLYPLLVAEGETPIERVDLRYDTGLAVLRMTSKQRQASL